MSQGKRFDFHCETSTIIERDTEAVYQALFYLEGWSKLLPHVKAVNVLYDDGRYQEFTMTVTSETDAGTLKVRSVRLCDQVNRQIGFFQPEPPPFLKHHAGGWKFFPLGESKCEVLTFHNWNLNHEVAACTFQNAGGKYEERVSNLLLSHAKFALENWKRILEAEQSVVGGRL